MTVLAPVAAQKGLNAVAQGRARAQLGLFTARRLTVTSEQQHNLALINMYRYQAGVAPLQLDLQMNDFALAGSQELMRDHIAHKHFKDSGSPFWETQGYQNGTPIVGWPNNPKVNATIDQILASMMAEPLPPPGLFNHHSIIIDPRHTKVGVGLVIDGANGLLYLTNDFTP
jgi:uncharacterized protein YkwD